MARTFHEVAGQHSEARRVGVDAEQETPFKSFLVKGEMLLLERTNPDAIGTRFLLLGFDAIHAIKLVDPLKEEVFTAAGFVGHFAKV